MARHGRSPRRGPPPRINLTRRKYSPQPHDGCGLDITLPLLYDAFKPPSKREVNKWLASYKSTSVLALSPQASSKSPSILTLSPQSESSPLPSPSGGTAIDDVEQECEDLKLQQNNILEKQKKLKEMEIPASLPKKCTIHFKYRVLYLSSQQRLCRKNLLW